jgi:peptidoglycan-associated lipoprotein
VCKDQSCRACAADAECGEGGRCREGRCLRRGQCDTDEDCAEDEDCRNHVCLKAREALTPGSDTPKCTLQAVYFGFDQYVIAEDAKPLLQKNAECLSTTPRGVAVVGMTDPRGTVEYNIGLSDDRAQAVMTYLSRLGIDPARLRKIPKGATEATGSDETGWALDRRVDLVWDK